MPATIVDSAIFGNLFSTEAMRQVWSDENRTRKYLDIEAALARVQARLGIIPAKAAAEIVRNCRLEKIDLGKLRAQTERRLQGGPKAAQGPDDLAYSRRLVAGGDDTDEASRLAHRRGTSRDAGSP